MCLDLGADRRTFAVFFRHSRRVETRLGLGMETLMNTFFKLLAALMFGAAALGFSTASAGHDDRYDEDRPDYCDIDHDHRSHAANYYDYYPADRYYRAGPYRGSRVSLSVRVGDGRYRGYRGGHYYDDHGYGGRYRSAPVHREFYEPSHRARIVVIEEVAYTRHGPRLTCTVTAHGPDAHHLSYRSLRRIAANECSPRAHVHIEG